MLPVMCRQVLHTLPAACAVCFLLFSLFSLFPVVRLCPVRACIACRRALDHHERCTHSMCMCFWHAHGMLCGCPTSVGTAAVVTLVSTGLSCPAPTNARAVAVTGLDSRFNLDLQVPAPHGADTACKAWCSLGSVCSRLEIMIPSQLQTLLRLASSKTILRQLGLESGPSCGSCTPWRSALQDCAALAVKIYLV